jgi:predicted acylesterase/phospholipase RssA
MDSNKIHLVCSSGGVRCFSYIGAIQKLKEHDIEIASVSACSMGTIIGALVCSGMKIEDLQQTILNFDFSLVKRKKPFYWLHLLKYPFAIYKVPDYSRILELLIGRDPTLGELVIPFATAAIDIRQRRMLVYSSETHPEMKLSEVIKIATAIPPLSQPYKKDARILVDAAVASESPVWIAANNPGNYPIVVLKTAHPPDESYRKNLAKFLENIFTASVGSHDYFTSTQTSRAIDVEINCGSMQAENFSISKSQIESIILEGQTVMERKLADYDGNFNDVLEVEEMTSVKTMSNTADRAEVLASQMINQYQNEIKNRTQVFISYSRKDRAWLEKLQVHMKSVTRFTGIKTWDDTNIKPGKYWNDEIEKALIATRVAVFLVTPDFLASDFIQDEEMKYFLTMSDKEKVPILWIAVSACNFQLTPLNQIQCANDPTRPLDSLSQAEQNVVLANICMAVIKAMDEANPAAPVA